ncbi:uncharacterized protein LOC130695116 isoform X2 [Daphnia carinata]|uniref:uncharacterized protein LOC130695116 isoform X2 n=1 Tax=Daphnia carinata TaxID=120202 RepID=UPI00257CAB1D|nr:uncharacterized protein LOC130695116 isoform X2 [Daphnia carinata]
MLVTCRKDSECLTPGTYCLDGFCDGHCIPCEKFLRQPPHSGGCAKREEDCGSCIPGTVAEELVGMRHAFRCKKSENFIPATTQSSLTEPFTISKWLTGTLIVVTLALFVRGSFYIKRKAISENAERDPPYNPYWREEDEINQLLNSNVQPNTELPLEWVQNVQPQPMNVPFDTNSGENLDPSVLTLPSGVPSNPEGSASDDVLGGMLEVETIEFSNYRNETRSREDNHGELSCEEARNQTELYIEPSTTDDVRVVIKMEPDGLDIETGADTRERCYEQIDVGFSVKAKRVVTKTA